MKFGTKVIHAGIEPDPCTGAIMTPIYQTSTYVQSSIGNHKGYEYSRTHNPTRDALQKNIAALENGKHGLCFSSGMAAIDAILKLFKQGDEIISTNDLYGGTYRMFTKIFARYGIKFHFISMSDIDVLEKHINENTKLVWIETPTNPLLNIVDINAASKIIKSLNQRYSVVKEQEILLAVDNTFATPYLQNPLDLGADIVMHSATKYLAGHSDVVMGTIVVTDDTLAEQLAFIQNSCGAVPGPMDCFLTLRGIKTLHIRMQRHCENARIIAEFLNCHYKIENVYWPGFKTHENYSIIKKQMNGFGGMVSFTLKENENSSSVQGAIQVMEKFKLFLLAESLGGIESLCGHPSSMTHSSIPKEEREKAGLKDSLIRLSVGIEDIDDLIEDLKQALGD